MSERSLVSVTQDDVADPADPRHARGPPDPWTKPSGGQPPPPLSCPEVLDEDSTWAVAVDLAVATCSHVRSPPPLGSPHYLRPITWRVNGLSVLPRRCCCGGVVRVGG